MDVENEHIDVSVVLPVYNEAGHVEAEIARIRSALDASNYTYEIIVVDDGSSDGTNERIRTLAGIRLITLGRNQGTGTARRYGTRAARGDVVVWTDVDMTYPNDEIPSLVKELEGFDQVVGARRTEEGSVKILRTPAKWLIRKLASYLAETKIPDLNSGFRAFRREVAAQYLHRLPKGFSCVTTMTMTFLTNGYSVKYVPIDYAPREGTSKFHWWKDTQRYLLQVLRLIMSYDPMRVFVPIGVLVGGIGVAKLGFDLIVHPIAIAVDTLLLLSAAFQIFAIGLVADVVVQTSGRRDDVLPADLL
jgi:glycosyltransferase involved in cell wall biosynthesis